MITTVSIQLSLTIVIITGLFFVALGYLNSKKSISTQDYIVGNRDENTFTLTASLTASALGAWILFGPASAATWGGVGAVIGYALGTAAPMLFLYNFGPKIRKEFPKGLALTEFIKKRFGDGILKLSLFLILFYLTIFLIAEVTAIASLLNLISKTPLWATSAITLIICLLYILRGGFKLSVITDKYQFIIVSVIILISFTIILNSLEISSFEIIKKNSPNLLDTKYLPNYTAGLTFFIAVASTNLFHQGNWQRVFAARNNNKLKASLLYSSFIIFLIVFWMGYTGLISYSLNQEVNPDLAFFDLLLKNKDLYIILGILILALSLTLSTIDTLINAISSLLMLSGKQINKILSGKELKKKVIFIILLLSLIVFLISSKGYSILYLFLLADLLCCAAVITIFYGFFKKKIEFKLARLSILLGLISGFLFFPSIDFQKSLLVGIILPLDLFSSLVANNLLFISFAISILTQFFVILYYSFRNSFR